MMSKHHKVSLMYESTIKKVKVEIIARKEDNVSLNNTGNELFLVYIILWKKKFNKKNLQRIYLQLDTFKELGLTSIRKQIFAES